MSGYRHRHEYFTGRKAGVKKIDTARWMFNELELRLFIWVMTQYTALLPHRLKETGQKQTCDVEGVVGTVCILCVSRYCGARQRQSSLNGTKRRERK